MPLHDTQAFVLRTYKLAEADKVCVLLTRESGKLRGIAYGAAKMRSRFGSSLEPFTEITATYFEKEGRDLVSISHAEIVSSHFAEAASSIVAGAAMSYMADLLCEFLPDRESNEVVYRLVRATLEALGKDEHINLLVRYFETWLLKLGGFYPDLTHCSGCNEPAPPEGDLWVSNDGAPLCLACGGSRGLRVDLRLRETVHRVMTESPTRFAASPPPADHVDRLAEISLIIIRHALERDLKSYALFNRLRREIENGAGSIP